MNRVVYYRMACAFNMHTSFNSATDSSVKLLGTTGIDDALDEYLVSAIALKAFVKRRY